MPARPPLPIDERLPAIAEALASRRCVVLCAEPGAGKTTRVPPALLERCDGEVLVLEPRRLAARMAARRVAEELGEPLGGTVGYHVRFDEVAGPRTRIRFLTEGLLGRRLLGDPALRGVSVVVLDEFHERHLQGDLALALLRRLHRSRADLALCVMSATLEVEPLARFLDAQVIEVPGRPFEVAIEHREAPRGKEEPLPLERQVAQALRRLCASGLDGDVLAFLPGAAEIRRAGEACAEVAAQNSVEIVVLHGDLSAAEQDRAVRPGPRRRLILSTNVAETSLTIEGVVAVIDSGLARVARHSPWSGLPRLATENISRASATQRAGRAGRTRPGRCVRLYTRADFEARPSHDAPEIRRADLAETALSLHAVGIAPRALEWLEAPAPAGIDAAETLLRRLGALDPAGAVTPLGRRMSALHTHPRLARLALEAAARGELARGALAAAILGEREVLASLRGRGLGRARPQRDESGPSDLLARVEALAVEGGARGEGPPVDRGAAAAVRRAAESIERAIRRSDGPTVSETTSGRSSPGGRPGPTPNPASRRAGRGARPDPGMDPAGEEALLIATLAGFPDRLARRRAAHGLEVILGRSAGGATARLDEASVVRDAMLLLALDADERPGGPRIRIASAVEPEWLLDLFPGAIEERSGARFDPAAERVEVVSGLGYDGVILDESRRSDVISDEVSRVLAEAARAAGPARFAEAGELARLAARVSFARGLAPEMDLPPLDEPAQIEALTAMCAGRRSFADLSGRLVPALLERLPAPSRAALERLAPERIALAGGRRVRVEYAEAQAPWIESRLQDFFGLTDGPRVGGGTIALVLHLTAPNQRAVQVTRDLAGFWARHYPALRRQLMRRYPKHAWPEDPLAATPPAPRGR